MVLGHYSSTRERPIDGPSGERARKHPHEWIVSFVAVAFLTLVVLAIVARIVDWDPINSYVPDVARLQSPRYVAKEFIVAAEDLKGVYGNYDVPSQIFSYTTLYSAQRFWAEIDDRAHARGWMLQHQDGELREYVLISPRRGTHVHHTAIQLRVARDPHQQRVVVAWATADSKVPLEAFPNPRVSIQADFAERVIWPQFERLTGMNVP